MALKRRTWIIAVAAAAGLLLLVSTVYLFPLNLLSTQQKPEQSTQPLHDYYIIIDEATGADLMYVPLVVSIGDEVITEDNKRYTIVKVEQNRAYARYVEDVDLEKYKTKQPGQ